MNSTDLYNTLQVQFSGGSNINVAQLDDASYTDIFDQLGISYTISLSGSGWLSGQGSNADEIRFTGFTAGASIVLGLPPATPLTIRFIPVAPNSDSFTLCIELTLSASWKFGQSFTMLDTNVYETIRLLPSPASLLIVTANASTVSYPGTNPPLYFSGYIDPNSSICTVLTWFIAGGIQNPVAGAINYQAVTSAASMNLALATSTVSDIFGNAVPPLTFSVSLYCGLNEAINLYEPGILFETDIVFGQETVALRALYTNAVINAINLSVENLSLSFNTCLTSIGAFFGNSQAIVNSIPESISTSALNVTGLTFRVALSNLDVQYGFLAVSVLEDTIWDIWPGYISLSNIEFSFLIYAPFSSSPGYNFRFSGITRFGGDENGLPMLVSAELPGLVLEATLYGEPYNLVPLLQYFFGNSKGLPDELDINELSFRAVVPENVYRFELDIAGEWRIPFGTSNELVFDELKIQLEYENDAPSGVLFGEFRIGYNVFRIELNLSEANQVLSGVWNNTTNPLDYEDIAIAFGMYGLPRLPLGIDLQLTGASFDLETAGPSASFTLTSDNYGSAALIAGKDENGNWGFVFGMIAGLELSVNLTDIDVIGNFVPEGMDVIAVNNLRFVGATSAIPVYSPSPRLLQILGTQINSGLVLSIDLNIGSLFSETFSVRFGGLDDGTAIDTPPTSTSENGGIENPPTGNNSVQLDVTTPTVPAALPGPTSAWINVQRSFGPVHIARIGFRITENNALGLLLDADVNLAGLTIGLSGLEADIPINAPFWPGFSLAGLEIGYVTPGFTLAGALVKAYGVTPTMYTGELILQAGSFGASAFGSYTTTNNEPSLFAFLALNIPIGGPPFCVVTGLSVGFGYNRRLILPTIETVQTYPLVQAAMGITDPQQTINALNQYIVPADNQYWLAAGIRFTSFEMLNAYALLTASFGTQTELALMGEALLTLPIAVPGEEELILAQADMVLLASINPSLGQIAISAQLTSRSYVLDRNAQITGGFAFYFWFGKSAHKGDFVVTLGGYNPYFTTPTYYPKVPSLGLNWQVSGLISIKGGLYCALTPSVIMAGGNLSASYSSGNVKAWFNANADFLVRFKPFAFDSTIGVSVGASYKINLHFTTKTISVTVGASLKLWGPPFAGTATVDLGVMSFTIAFGAAKRATSTSIGWTEFRNSFLPPEPGTLTQSQQLEVSNGNTPTQSLIQFNADRGLISTATKDQLGEYGIALPDGSIAWRMNPGKSRISITTSIPSKTILIDPWPDNSNSLGGLNTDFGIGPMSLAPANVGVQLSVTVSYNGNADRTNLWSVKPLVENIPSGLWKNTTNSMTGDALVRNVLQGIQLTPKPTRPDVMAAMPLSQLLFRGVPDPRLCNWSPTLPPSADYFAQGMQNFQSSLASSAVTATRNSVLDVLGAQGLTVYSAAEIQLDDYTANAQNILYAAPRICYLGETSSSSSIQ